MLSLVVPTFNERANICLLLDRIRAEIRNHDIEAEIIVVDDNSPDGTAWAVQKHCSQSVKLIRRTGKWGLSSAVIAGWRQATGNILGVMDADLSHAPERIHVLLNSLQQADLVVGSRYCRGGMIKDWGPMRRFASWGATLVGRVFTEVSDPMSGFFVLRRDCVTLSRLDPKGFKILLEVLVKGDCDRIREVPIIFRDRERGESKMSLREMFKYLHNIAHYLLLRRDIWMQFFSFAFIGSLGALINILLMSILVEVVGVWYMSAAILTFLIALAPNICLATVFASRESQSRLTSRRLFKFGTVSVCALSVNLLVLYTLTEMAGIFYLFSQLFAIGSAFLLNFFANKLWTFRTP